MMDACFWQFEDDDGSYSTSCNHMFIFNDEGPNENGFRFCPYCGKSLLDSTNAPQSRAAILRNIEEVK